ncbi:MULTISPECIES: DUF5615 family PIN-like protein [unclassified Microcoleus]|uniref:DUF5615 family PIN-like protein n=1 Tax=unclassified Microcoleus TaxID=2642155 RepID=UPI001D9594FA|nr:MULTISPECIES: DUF5615 family PIN-like protein [unclassified Microcoleus]TAE15130.1 MAG: ACP S-malonyltransferase [Oscillatoriales cyanobacterium]TAE27033.1 MAG: ACP S-malonyltransferase [Oscillatoriales cyanobacterium]TAE42653.1 MAG: ACP S-malonyltransferase [Oscillatoriales cyanobacterium]TAF92312.1 MAG: ACP S-malonyltransferase [Oscillatoriales cyanobacterium]TAG72019.1 MAG: ACP S-malonyltransferase [Oscillatoriales cyanobacterium]
MIFLIDHNLNGHAIIFFGSIANQGWLDIIPIRFVTFAQMELPINSDDRVVWRLAQENKMILLTANRSMKGKDSGSPELMVIILSNARNKLIRDF